MAFAAHLVDDRGSLGIEGSLRIGRPGGAGRNQAAEVDHIGIALVAVVAAEVLPGPDGAADRSEILRVVRRLIKILGIEIESRAERLDFAEINQGEGCILFLFICGTVLVEAVADRFSEHGHIRVGIGSQAVPERLIIPAAAGLDLLRADHILRIGGEYGRGFNRAHEACVKADEIKAVRQSVLHAAERSVDCAQGEAVQIKQLIKADAVDAAAAVIP